MYRLIFKLLLLLATLAISLAQYELTERQKWQSLDSHNKFRNNLGWKDRKGKKFSGYAVNMKRLKWDDELEKSAQETANLCTKEHIIPMVGVNWKLMDLFGGHVGENLYFGGGYKANRNVGNDFVAGWYEEIMFYDWHKHNCYPKNECGHLTQMLWDDTEFIGCAQQKCQTTYKNSKSPQTWTNYVCRYGPGGNWQGQKPFETTQKYNKRCKHGLVPDDKYPRLCV
ncbi:uncharacterized protein LOC134840312 [Symsagittifera roscoffensis]|uniref:uncharacterized protein LOC134840312 n=1 Tax=Symsagittifera roscoffensis TaxID=84072 RepID=UPI00307B5A14